MKSKLAIVITLGALLSMPLRAAAQQAATAKPSAPPAAQAAPVTPTFSNSVLPVFRGMEREFVSAADAMPEAKYRYAPSAGDFKGVRTFSEEVKHVAFTNFMLAATINGTAPPAATPNENGPPEMTAKADIMKYLRDSFAAAEQAIGSMTAENVLTPIPSPFGGNRPTTRLAMSVLAVGHGFDHFGQMVEYLRNNGIVPPSSAGQPAAGSAGN